MGPSTFLVILAAICFANAQLPRRLQIPGALPLGTLGDGRPIPYRRVVPAGPVKTIRRPAPSPTPIRPVVEESDEDDDGPLSNGEVAKLQNIPLASPSPQPIRLPPPPPPQPAPQRLDDDEDDDLPPARNYAQAAPIQFRPAPAVRLQQQQAPVRQVQVQRAAAPQRPRQPIQALVSDEEGGRRPSRGRKPEIKILRKYREDNPDGSITWGYENEDGSFKEETIGTDCITRGKYGYVDPEGNRREYAYETGLKCDEQPEEELLPEEPLQYKPNNKGLKRPPIQTVPIRLP